MFVSVLSSALGVSIKYRNQNVYSVQGDVRIRNQPGMITAALLYVQLLYVHTFKQCKSTLFCVPNTLTDEVC